MKASPHSRAATQGKGNGKEKDKGNVKMKAKVKASGMQRRLGQDNAQSLQGGVKVQRLRQRDSPDAKYRKLYQGYG